MASRYTASDPGAYERLMGRWSPRLAEPFLDHAGLVAGETVLDIGCGTGSLTTALAARAEPRAVIGVDIAFPFVRFAAAQESRVAFVTGDACALPFADASIDHALSLLALNFVSNPAQAMSEIHRVVRPGGRVAAAVWDFAGGLVYQRIFWDTAAALDPAASRARAKQLSAPLLAPGALAAALAAAGFMEVHGSSMTIRMDYADFADYWEPIAAATGPVGDYVRATPPALLAEIRGKIRDAYLSGRPDGLRSLAATAWVATGRR
ncbi:MAG TPA: class I SAM-dependent methyltransferase [Hypericibacter adhaerens]|uniref:class I SAM-dependent methyltransferase n=1 Tax=Hypericibacter adhaerens TaxID=2602016 RepID=UPI002C781AD3|nr:class I SAM-dependent methyltransferase [Hypericibacter adhaerens]HWA42533.1 class I SAM-dependent methyltransferase [Hypericibacter adhaerens]